MIVDAAMLNFPSLLTKPGDKLLLFPQLKIKEYIKSMDQQFSLQLLDCNH
jgi:hypothetical protein